MEEITLAQPGSLVGSGGDGDRVYRKARLLRAGSYPDKALTVTEEDLDGLVARFAAARAAGGTVPVKVEHIDSPLDPLGTIAMLGRSGEELFAVVEFEADVDALLRRRGIAGLSVGLHREPLELREVSLVLRPRVEDAALLSAENVEARERLRHWKAEGKLTPATEEAAARLLGAPGDRLLWFANGPGAGEVREAFETFLAALPVVQPRVPGVPGDAFPAPDGDAPTDGERGLAARLGVKVERLVAQRRGRALRGHGGHDRGAQERKDG